MAFRGMHPQGRPTHRQTGITPLHMRQGTRRHTCQTPEHQPHPRARTCTTRYRTPQPPATPIHHTLSHTTPPVDARGRAVHRSSQAVPLPHTHPAAGHHTGPPGEHRTPPTPRRLRPHTPLLLRPTPRQPPGTPTKTPTPTRPQTASPPHPIQPMVRTPLDPRPRKIHQMHLWPRGRRNLGPLQGVPPVPSTGHPHRLEPNPHHRTARLMADAVPGNPATCYRPQADRGTRGGPQGTRPHSPLHLATHRRRGPPSHGGAHATNGHYQDSGAAHIQHPQVPAACSNPTPNRPRPPPPTPVLPTMRTYPMTHQNGTPTTPTHHPASTTLAGHTRAPQAPHARPLACARRQPPSPHGTIRPQVPPAASHRMPPLRTPAATTDSPTRQPGPLGLPGGRAPPHPLPPLRGPQPPPPRAARGPSRTSPCQPPQPLRAAHRHPPVPPGRVLRGGRGGPHMDHSRGHGQRTPASPQPNLAPQRGRLVLLALYLHHRDLHLPDPQPPAPKAAVLTPEAWADTAPEKIAAYLRITCRRFNTALGRQKGTPYPLSALP